MTRPIVEIEHYFNKEKIMDQNLQEQILYILYYRVTFPVQDQMPYTGASKGIGMRAPSVQSSLSVMSNSL